MIHLPGCRICYRRLLLSWCTVDLSMKLVVSAHDPFLTGMFQWCIEFDGIGCAILEDEAPAGKLSIKINWSRAVENTATATR